MKQFLDKDFLLSTEMAKTLYHVYQIFLENGFCRIR